MSIEELKAENALLKAENDKYRRVFQGEKDWVLMEPSEHARLKAEVERLKEGNECLDQMHEKEMARSAFLCEEVNRTTAWGRGLESDLSWARAELLMVKAEVERLTKAGDAMAVALNLNGDVFDNHEKKLAQSAWDAAKEGKGQP